MSLDHTDPNVAICIAHATSRRPLPDQAGLGQRWTEISIYWVKPKAGGTQRRWISVISGCSSHPGEDTKLTKVRKASLDGLLHLIDDTMMGRMVKKDALRWAETNRALIDGAGSEATFIPDQALRDAIDLAEKFVARNASNWPIDGVFSAIQLLVDHAKASMGEPVDD